MYGQAISSNGGIVTFSSDDEGLPGGDGLTDHVYVRDIGHHRTWLVDRNKRGKPGNDDAYNSAISGNGRFVIYESEATNLPGQIGNQIYVRDLKRKRTMLAGPNSAGEPQNGYAEFGQLSGDGRLVIFTSDADNLPAGNLGDHSLVYVRNMRTGKTRMIARAASGAPATTEANEGSISRDGLWAMFVSGSDNLGGNPLYSNIFRVRLGR